SGPPAVGPELTAESPDRNRRGLAVRREVPGPSLVGDRPPPHAVAPGPPSGISGGEWEPVLGPGSNPFSMWQQQMQLMETFHDEMPMMVRMFIAMHREPLAAVREELARVQHLTRELTRLNARMGHFRESAKPTMTARAGSQRSEQGPAPQTDSSKPQGDPRP